MNYNINDIILHPTHINERHCDEKWYFSPVYRDFHNLTLVLSGEGTLMSQGKEFPMLPGMLVYNFDGETYGFSTSKTNPMHLFGMNFFCYCANISQYGCEAKRIRKLPLQQILYPRNFETIHRLFKNLVAAWENKSSTSMLKCRSIFIGMICEIIHEQKASGNSKISNIISDAANYINQNYQSKITLGTLSEKYGVSEVYFGSCFKRITGKTLVEYVNDVRLDAASDLISTGVKIQQAALISGFNDPFYFSRVFKKRKNISPRQYLRSEINRF